MNISSYYTRKIICKANVETWGKEVYTMYSFISVPIWNIWNELTCFSTGSSTYKYSSTSSNIKKLIRWLGWHLWKTNSQILPAYSIPDISLLKSKICPHLLYTYETERSKRKTIQLRIFFHSIHQTTTTYSASTWGGGVLVENFPSALVTNSYRPFPISCTPYNSSDYRNEEVVNFNFVFSTHISTHSAFVGRVSSKIVSTNREIEHFRNFSTSRQLSYKHNISTHSTFLSAKRTHISTAACGTRQSRRFKNLPNFLPLSHTL